MAFTNRNSNFSFNDAFPSAVLFSPTVPVYTPTGDYSGDVNLYVYNPVAMIHQNVNEGKRKNLNYSAKIDYDIVKNLTLTVNYAQQFDNVLNGEYYSSKSLYRGLERNGLARRFSI